MPTCTLLPNNKVCEQDVHDIEYLICNVAMLWRRLLNAKIKTLGISGTEKRVMFSIACYPGLTQVQIAKRLELEPQNLVRLLDKLEAQDWIAKKADPQDRRVKCLYVTEKANQIIGQIKQLGNAVKPEILAGIDEKKLIQMVESLTAIKSNLVELLAPLGEE